MTRSVIEQWWEALLHEGHTRNVHTLDFVHALLQRAIPRMGFEENPTLTLVLTDGAEANRSFDLPRKKSPGSSRSRYPGRATARVAAATAISRKPRPRSPGWRPCRWTLHSYCTRSRLLRLCALLARAHGDETGYRDYRDRYRALATSLGFEGHIKWAEAMP